VRSQLNAKSLGDTNHECMTLLPDADDVFRTFFAPWYAPKDLARRGFAATRPDVQGWAPAGVATLDASPPTIEGQQAAEAQVRRMLEAAAEDWTRSVHVSGSPSTAWIDAFDRYYDRRRVAALIASSNPNDFGNELVVLCCEFGAVLGHVLREEAPELEWLYDWPYWESALYDPRHGMRINVFHWAIKKFSDYGVDDGFCAKLLHCRDLMQRGWSATTVA
jgi:hypothetical protein